MKKILIALTALLTMATNANAMGYEQARQEALFLTDKMAYELNLTEDQYEAAYEINLDYLMSVGSRDDLYGVYWDRRNLDLSYILLDWQYNAYCAASYFYRPLYWSAGFWHFGIYARYPHRSYFYFGRPHFWYTYRGGHSWHHNGGRSWYHGRDWGMTHRNGPSGHGHGMRNGFDRGDYRNHQPGGYSGHGRGNDNNRGGMGNRRGFDNNRNGGINGGRSRDNNRNEGMNNGRRRDDNSRNEGIINGRNRDNNNNRGGSMTSRKRTLEPGSRMESNNRFDRSGSEVRNQNVDRSAKMRESSTRSTARGNFERRNVGSGASQSRPSGTFSPSRSSSSAQPRTGNSSSMSRQMRSNSSSSGSFSRPSGGGSRGSSSFGGGSRSGNSGSSSHGGGGHFGGRR